MASPGGLEPPTSCLGGRPSILLRYGDLFTFLNDYTQNIRNLDLNGLTLRRRTLYPTEVQRHIFSYSWNHYLQHVIKVYHTFTEFARCIFDILKLGGNKWVHKHLQNIGCIITNSVISFYNKGLYSKELLWHTNLHR